MPATLPETMVFAPGDLDYITKFNNLVADFNAVYALLLASSNGALFTATSATSNVVATGSKTWTLTEAAQRAFGVGQAIRIADTAAPTANFLDGQVTAYAHPSITINVTTATGSGTKTAWTFSIPAVSGIVPIASGGTGAADAPTARTNLGLGTAATTAASAYATSTQGTTADAALARAGGTMTGAIAMGNKDITGTKVLAFNGEVNNTPAASAVTIDFSTGSIQKTTLNAATIAITISNLQIGWNHLRIIQDATGGRAVTFTGIVSTRWGGIASQPALNTAVAGESILSIFWDGANAAQSLMRIGTP